MTLLKRVNALVSKNAWVAAFHNSMLIASDNGTVLLEKDVAIRIAREILEGVSEGDLIVASKGTVVAHKMFLYTPSVLKRVEDGEL